MVVDLALPVGSRVIQPQRYYRAVQPEVGKAHSSDDALMLSGNNEHHGPRDRATEKVGRSRLDAARQALNASRGLP